MAKDKETIRVISKQHKNGRILWFYDEDDCCIGAISDFSQYCIDDFKWLFQFLSNIHWKFDIFSNCEVEEHNEEWEDEWDTYKNTTIVHKFKNGMKFTTYLPDMDTGAYGYDIKSVFKYVYNRTGIKIKFVKRLENNKNDNNF